MRGQSLSVPDGSAHSTQEKERVSLAHTLTGIQVPLVEILQLGSSLPLALLSWSLLHTRWHRIGFTWRQRGTASRVVKERDTEPTSRALPHYPRSPRQGNTSKVPSILFTFLEELRVQGVKRVQALPGVWGLLSRKQAEAKKGKIQASDPENTGRTSFSGRSAKGLKSNRAKIGQMMPLNIPSLAGPRDLAFLTCSREAGSRAPCRSRSMYLLGKMALCKKQSTSSPLPTPVHPGFQDPRSSA